MCILYGVIAIGSLLRDAFDIRLCWRGFTKGISYVGYPDIKIIPDIKPLFPFPLKIKGGLFLLIS